MIIAFSTTSVIKIPSSTLPVFAVRRITASPGKPSLYQAQQAQAFLIFQAPAIQGPTTGVTESSLAFGYQVIRKQQLINKYQSVLPNLLPSVSP